MSRLLAVDDAGDCVKALYDVELRVALYKVSR